MKTRQATAAKARARSFGPSFAARTTLNTSSKMGLFNRKKKNRNLSPFDLDWGEITPDLYSKEKKEVINISNHNLLTAEGRLLSPIYSAGRVVWYNKHLPAEIRQKVLLDIRGQRAIKFDENVHNGWRSAMNSRISEKEKIEFTLNLLF